ncbi:MAG TPA: proteasome accessory factor PafA2 family protein, partial [Abditibacteriaceae bacterium]
SLDLAYHNVDSEAGLYYGLVEAGAMTTMVDEAEIEAARVEPPRNTRATLRSAIVQRFSDRIKKVSWGGFVAEEAGHRYTLKLPEAAADYALLRNRIDSAETLYDVAAILRKA